MLRLLCCVFIAVTMSVCACGAGGDSSAGSAGSYLGSYLTPNLVGGTLECSNFYGPENLKTALKSTFNRTSPCPTELALGACEVPTGSGANAMQVEMVYYEQINSQGKKIATSFDNLNDGDACNTNGVWKKPYTATPPASVSAPTQGGGCSNLTLNSSKDSNGGSVSVSTTPAKGDAGIKPCDGCAKANCCSQLAACTTGQCINDLICWLMTPTPKFADAYGCPAGGTTSPDTTTNDLLSCLSASCTAECQ